MVSKSARVFCLLLFIAVLTTSLQHWVGGESLYSARHAQSRMSIHNILVRAVPETPESNLIKLESFGNERRVVIPWIAEGLARLAGDREKSLPAIYYYIDYACLYLSLLLFWVYLRHWFDPVRSLLGVTYVAVALITTYYLHFFHPWDRPTFLIWIALVMLIRADRLSAYLPLLALGICTKATAALLPLFYALANARSRALVRGLRFWWALAAQMLVVMGCYLLLNRIAFTSNAGLAGAYWNLTGDIVQKDRYFFDLLKFAHPAFLMFICPVLLLPFGWKRLDLFMRRSVLFAAVYLGIHLAFSYFAESRTLAPALIFLLPAGLRGLDALLGAEAASDP